MKVDLNEIEALREAGMLTSRPHPKGELLIHNYTPQCQYARNWTPLTLMCRGLITDAAGNVVARPFPKFFNHDEHERHIGPLNWQQSFTATKKFDGSLGVLYSGADGWAIATRGSFDSPQARVATRMFYDMGCHRHPLKEDLTYLFEIIYPENRIVVDYGGMRSLVLLDVIDTASGQSLDSLDVELEADLIGCPFAEPQELHADDILRAEQPANEEGYVVRFADGVRVKVKFADYVRLHRLLTGLNARMIWEHLRDGRPWEELVEHVPDEFYGWVKGIVSDLRQRFGQRQSEVYSAYLAVERRRGVPRKEVAEQFKKTPELAPALFAMFDGKAVDHIIWRDLRPEPSAPFVCAD